MISTNIITILLNIDPTLPEIEIQIDKPTKLKCMGLNGRDKRINRYHGSVVTTDNIRAIAKIVENSPDLHTLNLSYCIFNESNIESLIVAIESNRNLENVNFGHIISDIHHSFECLSMNFRKLNLAGCLDFRKQILPGICITDTLDVLDITCNQIPLPALQNLLTSLAQGSQLSSLSLTVNDFAIIDYLSTMIRYNWYLCCLKIDLDLKKLTYYVDYEAYSHIPESTWNYFTESFRYNSGIQYLKISSLNGSGHSLEIGTDRKYKAFASLVESFQYNQSLRSLNLKHFIVGRSTCKAIAEMLRHNQTITKLILAYHRCRDLDVVFEALMYNSSLEIIKLFGFFGSRDIWNSFIRQDLCSLKENIQFIRDVMAYNQTLTDIWLQDEDKHARMTMDFDPEVWYQLCYNRRQVRFHQDTLFKRTARVYARTHEWIPELVPDEVRNAIRAARDQFDFSYNS